MAGRPPAAHASGAPFARVDGAVVKYDLPVNLIGRTLYLKFQSFNAFGGGAQDLSTCVAFSYAPTGAGTVDPIAAQLASGIATDLGSVSTAANVFDDLGALTGAPSGSVTLGTAP